MSAASALPRGLTPLELKIRARSAAAACKGWRRVADPRVTADTVAVEVLQSLEGATYSRALGRAGTRIQRFLWLWRLRVAARQILFSKLRIRTRLVGFGHESEFHAQLTAQIWSRPPGPLISSSATPRRAATVPVVRRCIVQAPKTPALSLLPPATALRRRRRCLLTTATCSN
jgi:hypothetical protein